MTKKVTFMAPVIAAIGSTRDNLVWSEVTCTSVTFLILLDANWASCSASPTHGLTATSLAVATAGALTYRAEVTMKFTDIKNQKVNYLIGIKYPDIWEIMMS